MPVGNLLNAQLGISPKAVAYPRKKNKTQYASFQAIAQSCDVLQLQPSIESSLGLRMLELCIQINLAPSKRISLTQKSRNSLRSPSQSTIILATRIYGDEDHRAGRILLVVHNINEQDIRYAFLQASRLPFETTPDIFAILALTFTLGFSPPCRISSLTSFTLYFPTSGQPTARSEARNLLVYRPSRSVKSYFGFLKYSGTRQLRPSRKILLDEDGYQITHIGQGAFAVISRVLYRPTGEVRVMKRITFDDTGLAEYLAKNETNTLKAMAGSIWFPPLLNDFAEGGQFVITMPFYRRGDLAGFIEHKRYLGRKAAKFYSAQLVLAIQSLHKVGIIHRDIKPDNIFLDEDGHLVLADLGLAENIATIEGGESVITARYPQWVEARSRNEDDFPFLWVDELNPLEMSGVAGTFWYTAPEVFRKERYSFGVDYWSVGVIYHELVTGHIPFNHYNSYPENRRPTLDLRVKPGQLKDIDHWEQEALLELLAPYPSGRPKTLTDLKNNRIFDGVNWIEMSQKATRPPFLPPPLKEDTSHLSPACLKA